MLPPSEKVCHRMNSIASRPDRPARAPVRGRPRSAGKSAAILDAAGDLFLEQGFERTSMDEVARSAGVSKQTVYAHFLNKEQLFRAVIASKVAEYFPADMPGPATGGTAAEMLASVGRQYLRLILSEDAIAMFRVLAGNAGTHPRMVQLFFEEGPARLIAAIDSAMRAACDRDLIVCEDVARATSILCALLRGEIFLQRVLGLFGPVEEPAIAELARQAVDDFLKICTAERPA